MSVSYIMINAKDLIMRRNKMNGTEMRNALWKPNDEYAQNKFFPKWYQLNFDHTCSGLFEERMGHLQFNLHL